MNLRAQFLDAGVEEDGLVLLRGDDALESAVRKHAPPASRYCTSPRMATFEIVCRPASARPRSPCTGYEPAWSDSPAAWIPCSSLAWR